MVLFLCNGQMYMIVFHKDIGEMSLWVCKLIAWKPTLDKIPWFLNLSHRNTINDNEVLCVGCVLTINIHDTCSLNAIFFSRVWCGYGDWGGCGYDCCPVVWWCCWSLKVLKFVVLGWRVVVPIGREKWGWFCSYDDKLITCFGQW